MFPKHYSLKNEDEKHFEIHDCRDGSCFKVAKKGIHPANQIKILKMQKYSEGGEVKPNPLMPDPKKAKEAWQGAQYGQHNRLKKLLGLSDEKEPKVKKYAEGGSVGLGELVPDYRTTPVDQLQFPPDEPLMTRAGKYVGELGSEAVSDAYGAFKGLGQGIANVLSPVAEGAGQFVSGAATGAGFPPIDLSAPQVPEVQVGAEAQGPLPVTAAPQAPVATQSQMPTPVEPNIPGQKDLARYEKDYAKAAMTEVEAQGKRDKELAELHQLNVQSMQNRQKLFEEAMQKSQSHLDQLAQDMAASKIDPNRYWNSKSTGSKVASILGVLLGGIGAGLQKTTTNMGWEALQNNINKDIQAQKDELGKKQTLFSDNLKIQQNALAAEQATRLQMSAIVQGQMAAIAAKTNNPILQAQVQQKIALMKKQDLPLQVQLAQYQAQRQNAQQMNELIKSGKVSPETRVRMIPDDGDRRQATKELNDLAAIKTSIKRVDEIMDRAFEVNTVKNRLTNPIQSAELMDTIEAQLFPIVKQIAGERMTDADAKILIKPYISGMFTNQKTHGEKKLQLIQALVAQVPGRVQTLSSYGIINPGGLGESLLKESITDPLEGKTASDAKGNKLIRQGGKWVPLGR